MLVALRTIDVQPLCTSMVALTSARASRYFAATRALPKAALVIRSHGIKPLRMPSIADSTSVVAGADGSPRPANMVRF